jgi:hypothetical protein
MAGPGGTSGTTFNITRLPRSSIHALNSPSAMLTLVAAVTIRPFSYRRARFAHSISIATHPKRVTTTRKLTTVKHAQTRNPNTVRSTIHGAKAGINRR